MLYLQCKKKQSNTALQSRRAKKEAMRYLIMLMLWAFCSLAYAEPLKASWYSVASLKAESTYKTSKGIMANGKVFDENALTCATRLYKLGTMLKITNKVNGKSVVVKITDRIGKRFANKRIDLSKKAFSLIADLKEGIIPITVEEV